MLFLNLVLRFSGMYSGLLKINRNSWVNKRSTWLSVCLYSVCILLTCRITFAADNRVLDLRVVVDISGSMKKTDPANLRRPAVRMLAGLLPDKTRAGIWTFGKQVNMAVKVAEVDSRWRELANRESQSINSTGLFTNIEEAIKKSSYDWNTPDKRYDRNLIVLTDGHVDVSNNDDEDKASRSRIIKELIPKLEKAKVRVHTIAMSDDVDELLLSTISSYTNGFYAKVKNADDLNKAFLRMLEQSISLDTLPIKDNQFDVDKNIQDMTLLVFNKEKAKPVTITTPDNKTLTLEKHDTSVKWHHEKKYDLITINQPVAGKWKINSIPDDSNRVIVATNLKLAVSEIPSHVMVGDSLKLSVQLQEDNKVLENKKLLEKFIFSATKKSANGTEKKYPLKQEEHFYKYTILSIFSDGEQELIFRAESPTVTREARRHINVYAVPAEIDVMMKDDHINVSVLPALHLFKNETVKLKIILKDKTEKELLRKDERWEGMFDKKYLGSEFVVEMSATRLKDKPFSMSFKRVFNLSDKGAESLKMETAENIVENKKAKESESEDLKKDSPLKDDADSKNSSEDEENKNESEKSEGVPIIAILVSNIMLILIGAGTYIYIKRRKDNMTAELEEELTIE